MKTAPKVIFLFDDVGSGFATAISDGLQPSPNSSLKRSEESFDLPLDRYGVKGSKASGNITHYVDANGIPQVSILLLQKYESPVLACAISEVLASLAGENTLNMPSLIFPFFLYSSMLKLESKTPKNEKIYSIQIGPETDTMQAMASKITKAPSSMQIHHEPLACVIQLVRVLKTSAFILIGESRQHLSQKTSTGDLQIISEIGEGLASVASLQFVKEKVKWNPSKASKENEREPWRALYG